MKLLFIGLDGLSFDVYQEFDMPFLKSLASQGVEAKFISFDEPYMCTGPVWASVQTGVGPDVHGVQSGTAANWHTATWPGSLKTIWRLLNEKGLKCGLVNFPVTYPLRPVDPFIVCGFPAPWEQEGAKNPWDRVDFGGDLFWPKEIAPYIGTFRSAWMNYVSPQDFADTHEPYRAAQEGDREAQAYMMALLFRSLHETDRLTHALLHHYDLDLMATVFMETDTVGHFGGELPPEPRGTFLREVDMVVADLVKRVQPENVMVMSDHGCWGKAHVKEGTFVAAGPAFARAEDARIEVLEVAPTLLYVFGAYAPTMPMEPAYRLLTSGQVSQEGKGQITERLRAMGYLE